MTEQQQTIELSGQPIRPRAFYLITQWYTPKDHHRLEEVGQALRRNCENPFIHKIYLLNEQPDEALPIRSEKLVQVHLGRRLTLADAYGFATRHGKPDEAWCLLNLDIAFDTTLSELYFNHRNEVYCLTRYDLYDGDWKLFHGSYMDGLFDGPRADSQDAWLFLTPTTPLRSDPFTGLSADRVEIGRVGCDNKAAIILHASGLSCKNPSRTLKTYHYHFRRDARHDQSRESFRYPFPYLFLDPVAIDQPSTMTLCSTVTITVPVTNDDRLDTLQVQMNYSFQKKEFNSSSLVEVLES